MLPVKLMKVRDEAIVPRYQTEGAAGMDLSACIDSPVILQPGERAAIPTGIAVELPVGYEIQVRARSGLAAKHGIGMANGVGTIDSDFRGEIHAIVINWGNEPFTIEPGMRIAQMVVAKYERVELAVVAELGVTERGSGKFGSTGIK